MPTGQPIGDADKATAQEVPEGLDRDKLGTAKQLDEATAESAEGDPGCPSDWELWDCYWCGSSCCVNPRWWFYRCCSCGGVQGKERTPV